MTTMRHTVPLAVCALLLSCVTAQAAKRQERSRAAPPTHDESLFQALDYRQIGPYRGGRVTAVAGVPGHHRTFYMGSTGGGVWKTTDGGVTWTNVSDRRYEPADDGADIGVPTGEPGAPPEDEERDGEPRAIEADLPEGDEFGAASIGAVAVAPSDPNVVYVGTGSACIRGNVSAGDGLYKSEDGGHTWEYLGLPEAGQIGRIVVHPKDADTAFAAVLGHAFGPNRERGVYRTRDGGDSWQKVLYVSDEAGAVDLAMDPSNPRILYAAFWQAVRKPWTMISGGAGSGLFKTLDGGDTWYRLSEGLPEGPLGRIGVTVSPADPDRVWALVEAEDGGLFRSDDGGASFTLVSDDRNLRQRAWYYTHVYADPRDVDTVYVLNVLMWKSTDGGETFDNIPTPHGDNHDLWIDPLDPRIMVEGNDGGANVSYDGGESWSTQANQPTAEIYRIAVDDQWPYRIYGTQQDNTALSLSSAGSGHREDWYVIGGCESGHIAVDPRHPDITYTGCYGGTIGRHDRETGEEREVMAYPEMALGQQPRELQYRFQWNAPIRISPHDPTVLYHTSNHVHRSTDEGQSWTVVSPDLTRDDESKQGYAGGPITWDNTGVEVYGTVFAFEISPHQPGVLWAGSDDGLVHISRDDGDSWQEITPAAMPEYSTINTIELSRHAPGRAFLAVHRYRQDDFTPYMYRTDDHGATWERLSNRGIPEDHFVRVVREDPERRGLLYAGTEYGMYVSFDDGGSWQPLQLDLPLSPITDLHVHRGELVVATQGRGVWVLEELAPLRQLSEAVAGSRAHLFEPAGTTLLAGAGGDGLPIFYTLEEDLEPDEKEAEEDGDAASEDDTGEESEAGEATTEKPELVIEILDAEGEVLRTFSSTEPEKRAPNPWARFDPERRQRKTLPAKAGMNRWIWDLRLPDAHVVEDAVLWGTARGPRVPPGTYQARLLLGEIEQTRSFEIRPDPRLDRTQSGYEAEYELAQRIWRSISEAHRAIDTIRSVRRQVDGVVDRLREIEAARTDELEQAARELKRRLTDVEQQLHQTKAEAPQDVLNFPPQIDNQLLFLQRVVETAGLDPTQGSYDRYADLESALETILGELERLLAEDLAAFNREASELLPAPVVVPSRDGG